MDKKITKEFAIVCLVDSSKPVGFMNVFEEGDEWVKIKGCESCPTERRIKCCGKCPCVTPKGECYWQTMEPRSSRKPFYCVITPTIDKRNSNCVIEYRCIQGKNTGKIRRVKDKLNVFVG